MELAKLGPVFPAYAAKDGRCRCVAGSACDKPAKHPIGSLGSPWPSRRYPGSSADHQWSLQVPWANWASVAGDYFLAVRHRLEARWARLQGATGDQVQEAAGDGRVADRRWRQHILFKAPVGRKVRNTSNTLGDEYPGIDTRGGGNGYIIVPPSVHASGKQYAWMAGHAPWEIGIAEAPEWLLGLVVRSLGSGRRLGSGPAARSPTSSGGEHSGC